MLYMVIEKFKQGNAKAIGERFRAKGRMLPDGLTYQASWVDSSGARCFQIMETSNPELLRQWTSAWDDLVEFEIIAVKPSQEFWAGE